MSSNEHLEDIRTSLICTAGNYFGSMKRVEEAYTDLNTHFLRAQQLIANLQAQVAEHQREQQRKSNATKDRLAADQEDVRFRALIRHIIASLGCRDRI